MNLLMFTAKPSDFVVAGLDRQFYGQEVVSFRVENSLAPLRQQSECDLTGNRLIRKTSVIYGFLRE